MGAYSKLHDATYKELKRYFPYFTIRENIRPDWLLSSNNTRLELDMYIEEINTAIEIQGKQHYQFVPHFHKTYADFKAQLRRDKEKMELCKGRGIRLVEIAMYLDLEMFIKELLADKEPETMQLPLDEQRRIAKEEAKVNKKKNKPSIRRFKGFREWLKRKKLQKQGLLPPPMIYRKLPGSHRQRNRARHLLQCEMLNDGQQWRVWGGERDHIVEKQSKTIYHCECRHFPENKICSHIIRVMMEEKVFPSPVLE